LTGPRATHGRYAYSALPLRPRYRWPGDKGLAVYFALNLETFEFGAGLGAKLAASLGEPDVLNFTWRDYGNRVGAWRLRDAFDALNLPASVLVNSSLYDEAPELIAAFRARGDEIVAHGRSNSERQGAMNEAEEAAMIAEVTARIAAAEGRPPTGWLGPWISETAATPDLLAEAGYSYVLDWAMDEQPIRLNTRGGQPLLAVPYPQELNDIPMIVARQATGAEFADAIIDAFEEMLTLSRGAPLVMGIALHAYIVGYPHRLRHLKRALAHVAERRGDVWLTTSGGIASYCAGLLAGTIP
jgi:peptidoglycan/xylan/chitin deacetylase (PgdA/CDA1 family)